MRYCCTTSIWHILPPAIHIWLLSAGTSLLKADSPGFASHPARRQGSLDVLRCKDVSEHPISHRTETTVLGITAPSLLHLAALRHHLNRRVMLHFCGELLISNKPRRDAWETFELRCFLLTEPLRPRWAIRSCGAPSCGAEGERLRGGATHSCGERSPVLPPTSTPAGVPSLR